MYRKIIFIFGLFVSFALCAQQTTFRIAVVKYGGGGDWYANPTSLPNLAKFCNKELRTNIQTSTVEVGSPDICNYAMLHLTGHGNVLFSNTEVQNLRAYLISGGFLHIDDNYGLDPAIRREMKKVFPELDFVELPASHEIYQKPFSFPKGLPKIHEHDNKPAQGFALVWQGRVVCFYSYESDLGDGWEDTAVHSDSEDTRLKAHRMGANIVSFMSTN
ncbi:MAG: DUF4159 domain-containing protein [Bacteroidales bacterium]|jgi:hypothetical protein|nr:DUF4159 domain-containing protein [Bacteroidales bacterium]